MMSTANEPCEVAAGIDGADDQVSIVELGRGSLPVCLEDCTDRLFQSADYVAVAQQVNLEPDRLFSSGNRIENGLLFSIRFNEDLDALHSGPGCAIALAAGTNAAKIPSCR